MKVERQEAILKILEKGKYKIEPNQGKLYSLIKGVWVERVPTVMKDGKRQYLVSGITVYAHDLVWLAANGTYPQEKKIIPLDGDWSNARLHNLTIIQRRTT